MPWRRVRVRQNGQLLDRGFLAGSLAVIAIWLAYPFGFAHAHQFFGAHRVQLCLGDRIRRVAVLFAAGETQRRDKLPKLPQLKAFQVPSFVIGIGLLAVWFVLFRFEMLANLGEYSRGSDSLAGGNRRNPRYLIHPCSILHTRGKKGNRVVDWVSNSVMFTKEQRLVTQML